MDINLIKKSLLIILLASTVMMGVAQAERKTDEQLLSIGKEAFSVMRSKKIAEGLKGLSDAECTRAIALRYFDLMDHNQFARTSYNLSAGVDGLLWDYPDLIRDPSELRAMLENEKNASRFWILSTMAIRVARNWKDEKHDFVKEFSPMLLRNDRLAEMPGEYYFKSLTNVSFLTYNSIVENLEILKSGFIPPDDELPYPEKVSILIRWLRENYPGCEHLGEELSPSDKPANLRSQARPAATRQSREGQRNEVKNLASDSGLGSGSGVWKAIAATLFAILAGGVWWLKKSASKAAGTQ